MLKKKISILGLAITLALISSPAFANWTTDTDVQSTIQRMKTEDLLHTRSNGYFAITLDAITSTPQMSGLTASPTPRARYAVIIDGVVDRIVTWDGHSPNRVIDSYGIIVKLPTNAGVKYVDSTGVTRLKPITQGSIVSVYVAPEVKVTPSYEITLLSPVATPTEPESEVVVQTNAPIITSQTLNADQSVSMTVDVSGVVDIPSTSNVSVQVVTDGRSTSSIGLATGESTVTFKDLPQDQNVTVKTVILDTLTNTETVILNPVVATVASNVPAPTPARSDAVDKASISAPTVLSRVVNASGALAVAIAMPAVPNFDPSKTWATLYVVDRRSGSTTSIGTDGAAQTLNIEVGVGRDYITKLVIRDLASGQETVVQGQRISR